MKLQVIINTEEKRVDILYQGYNIIAESIYNEELPQKIVDLLQNELFENIEEITVLKR
jgi:hypothetical protein